MKTSDLRVGEHYAVILIGPVHPATTSYGGVTQSNAVRAKVIEVFDEPKRTGRYGSEKTNARVLVEDDRAGEAREHEVAARRILGTWAERLEAEEVSRRDRERWARERAERTTTNEALIEKLNARMIAAGLVGEDGEPLVEFSVDNRGDLYQRLAFGTSLRDLIERVTPEVVE